VMAVELTEPATVIPDPARIAKLAVEPKGTDCAVALWCINMPAVRIRPLMIRRGWFIGMCVSFSVRWNIDSLVILDVPFFALRYSHFKGCRIAPCLTDYNGVFTPGHLKTNVSRHG